MNRQDILQMGRQAGAFIELAQEKDLLWLERFAALVASAEREACAKVCEEMRTYVGRNNAVTQSSAQDCATAIRARGNVATNDTSQERVDETSESVHEPVAWVGLNLDNMAEAFHRVIEEHHSRKNPFHDPVNGDAMIALRELRGLISYMKRNTAPPQRTWVGLTDEDKESFWTGDQMSPKEWDELYAEVEAKLKEKNT